MIKGEGSVSLYLPPSIRDFEPRWIAFSTWMDHLPFGYDIVEALKPAILVELGTYSGLSYFTFCQSDESSVCWSTFVEVSVKI